MGKIFLYPTNNLRLPVDGKTTSGHKAALNYLEGRN